MRPIWFVCSALVLATVSCSKDRAKLGPLPEARPVVARAQGCQLRATLSPEKPSFHLGEPVVMTFTATPECDAKLTLLSVGDLESKFGRSEGFSVSARDSTGDVAPLRQGGDMFGGGIGHVDFTRDRPLQKELRVSDYVELGHPGRYDVTVTTTLQVGKRGAEKAGDESVHIQLVAAIDVSPS